MTFTRRQMGRIAMGGLVLPTFGQSNHGVALALSEQDLDCVAIAQLPRSSLVLGCRHRPKGRLTGSASIWLHLWSHSSTTLNEVSRVEIANAKDLFSLTVDGQDIFCVIQNDADLYQIIRLKGSGSIPKAILTLQGDRRPHVTSIRSMAESGLLFSGREGSRPLLRGIDGDGKLTREWPVPVSSIEIIVDLSVSSSAVAAVGISSGENSILNTTLALYSKSGNLMHSRMIAGLGLPRVSISNDQVAILGERASQGKIDLELSLFDLALTSKGVLRIETGFRLDMIPKSISASRQGFSVAYANPAGSLVIATVVNGEVRRFTPVSKASTYAWHKVRQVCSQRTTEGLLVAESTAVLIGGLQRQVVEVYLDDK